MSRPPRIESPCGYHDVEAREYVIPPPGAEVEVKIALGT